MMSENINIYPKLIIVMGVSGCGKSTIAQQLTEHLSISFLDADDFHSDEAKSHMAAGNPLTDEMRLPWIHDMCRHLQNHYVNSQGCILAFSGLKKRHRNMFRKLNFDISIFHLYADFKEIHHRLDKRDNHFFCSELLASQYQALESTVNESDVTLIDATLSIDIILQKMLVTLLENEYAVSGY